MTARCPYCGAGPDDGCALADGAEPGFCPWGEADETDPDYLRDLRDERARIDPEFMENDHDV